MNAVLTGIAASAFPLFVLGLVSFWRWRLAGAAVVLVGAMAAAFMLGILVPADVLVVPAGLGMTPALLLVLLWAAFGAVARTAGPLSIPGPPWLVAVIMGAGLGEVPAAAILSAGASSPKGAARLALAAAGGGMIGRIGDPALLLLAADYPVLIAALVPLGILMAAVARPREEDLVRTGNDNRNRTAVVGCVGFAAVFPPVTPWALLMGILALALLANDRRGHVDLSSVGWQCCAILIGMVAIVGGAAEQVAFGLEWGAELAGWLATPVLVLASALLTAMSDSTAMALFFSGVVDRALSVESGAIVPGLTAGIAVGGLGPLIAAGAVRAGIWVWILQVALAVGWALVWASV